MENRKDVDEKLAETMKIMHEHGMECGLKIAEVVKEMHPDAISIIPLYRSCIVITQDNRQKEQGDCTVHCYGDPHWMGGEIDIESLKRDEFHRLFYINGDRQGPLLYFTGSKQDPRMFIDTVQDPDGQIKRE